MEDDAAKAGAALKDIIGDVPHLRGNLYLGERATIAESLLPNALKTLREDDPLELLALVEGAVVDFGHSLGIYRPCLTHLTHL